MQPSSTADASEIPVVAALEATPDNSPSAEDEDSELAATASLTAEDTEQIVNGESDVLTEVRLDEATVLNDLFNSGLDDASVAGRFEQVYKGRQVNWTGEIVRVAPMDGRGRQRIAAFIGSADGKNPESGRVIALTAIAPEPVVAAGDVVSFSGALVNLDVAQRLFHVV